MELHERNTELTGLLQITVAVFEASDIYSEDCLDDNDVEQLATEIATFNRLCPDKLRDTDFAKLVASLADFAVDNEDGYDHYDDFQLAFQPFINRLIIHINMDD